MALIFLLRILQQNALIENATRTVAETEDVAIEITQDLARNREKIDSISNKVKRFKIHLAI